MPAPVNPFKAALKNGELQLGCWLSMGDRYAAEISATAGFDWLLVDNEHATNDLRSTRDQLAMIDASQSHAAVRVPVGENWIIKQMLDAGAQTILVPMVESGAQAEELVRAVRYPPAGVRGVGPTTARVSQFGMIKDYVPTADEQICLLVQVESRAGVAALDDILAVDGVDGVFIGPADLAADHGHLGNPGAPEVQEVIRHIFERVGESDKAAGTLAVDPAFARHCIDLGATFVATAMDVLLFAGALRNARAESDKLRG